MHFAGDVQKERKEAAGKKGRGNPAASGGADSDPEQRNADVVPLPDQLFE